MPSQNCPCSCCLGGLGLSSATLESWGCGMAAWLSSWLKKAGAVVWLAGKDWALVQLLRSPSARRFGWPGRGALHQFLGQVILRVWGCSGAGGSSNLGGGWPLLWEPGFALGQKQVAGRAGLGLAFSSWLSTHCPSLKARTYKDF